MVLNSIGQVRDMETFHYVLPYLDNKTLAQSACGLSWIWPIRTTCATRT